MTRQNCKECGTTYSAYDEGMRVVGLCPTCLEEGTGDGCHQYHYKPRAQYFKDITEAMTTIDKYIGIEWELELPDVDECRVKEYISGQAEQRTGGRWYPKYDGSLNNGVEFVSHPLSYKAMPDAVKSLHDALEDIAPTLYCADDSAGLHVHLSRAWFGVTASEQRRTVGKMMILVHNNYNALVHACGRTSYTNANKWAARPLYKKEWKLSETYYNGAARDYRDVETGCGPTRYKAINILNEHTIEWRLPQSVDNADDVIHQVNLLVRMVDFCRNHSRAQVESISNINSII